MLRKTANDSAQNWMRCWPVPLLVERSVCRPAKSTNISGRTTTAIGTAFFQPKRAMNAVRTQASIARKPPRDFVRNSV